MVSTKGQKGEREHERSEEKMGRMRVERSEENLKRRRGGCGEVEGEGRDVF